MRGGRDDGERIGFKSHLRAFVVPGEAAYLVSHGGITALHGDPAEILAPLLDGSRTPDAVVREAAESLAADDVLDSLAALDAAGLLRLRPVDTSSLPRTDPAAEAYWDLAGLDGGRVPADLAGRRIRVIPLAQLDLDEAYASCRAAGLTPAARHEEADLTLVLCDDYLDSRLREIDETHRAAKTPWLLAGTGSTESWVGPFFPAQGAHTGPCWSCLAHRLRGHRHAEEPLRRAFGPDVRSVRPPAVLPVGRSLTLHLAVIEAAKYLAGVRGHTQQSIHILDTIGLGSSLHPVARMPQCADCGDPGLVAARVREPFVLHSRPKAAHGGNGHRALTPAQMIERYGSLVDPVTGIIKEIRRAPGAPGFVNAFLAGENLAMRSPTLAGLRAGLRSLSGGKGLTEEEARASALGEAVERYSGTRQGDEPVVLGSYADLAPSAIHPHACQLYDERQFLEREAWNSTGARMQYVPPRFDEHATTEWTPVWSLTGQTRRLLPTSMLYYSEHAAPDGLFADSNGNAAGTSPEDALIQGFFELVERDAVALWWYNRTRHAAVDLAAFDEPYIAPLVEAYRTVHREVWALDLTSDFGFPVIAALSRRTDKPAEDIVFGFGAHFDPALALRRALTEMGQLLPLVVDAGPRGTGYRVDDADALDWWSRATVAGQPYLVPDPAQPARGPRHWSHEESADLAEDVAAVTEAVRACGMDLLVLDQTRPDIGLPVLKVIVPGLRHFWARFAPGRLFDVPVSLGLRETPLPYAELNPIPLFV